MIKNIGSQLDKIQTYIAGIEAITDVFIGGIFAGKPISEIKDPYLYFELENNSEKLGNDNVGTMLKNALFSFYIVGSKKDMPDVELYEYLDILSNNIITKSCQDKIVLEGGFKIGSIKEGNQSGVIRNINENPYIIAQYNINYKYLYP